MEFKKYMHIEKFGNQEVEGIEVGETYIFPKIDGTNASVWMNDGWTCAGSRNRELAIDNDNAGFMNYIINDNKIKAYLTEHPNHKLFGEWLVPHSLKTYRQDAWRKFYVFDVMVEHGENDFEYLPYSVYSEFLNKYELDYIQPIARIRNGSYDQFIKQLEKNVFLIEDGKGSGEGIVIKRYDFKNVYGRTVWAKIIKTEFKELHGHTMGAPVMAGKKMIEESIVEQFCTEALIEKTYAKIINAEGGWSSKYIPRLIETVYHDLITEEMWAILKKLKPKSINFQTLKSIMTTKIKEVKQEVF